MVSGVAVWMLAFLYGRGGFDLVLGVTAAVALPLLVDVVFIAVAQPKDQRGGLTADSDRSG
jgi:hypothetical protein